MRSSTSPSTRRSRASSLSRENGRRRASGEVSVCRVGAVQSDRKLIFSRRAACARPKRRRLASVASSRDDAEGRSIPRELEECLVVRRRAARHRSCAAEHWPAACTRRNSVNYEGSKKMRQNVRTGKQSETNRFPIPERRQATRSSFLRNPSLTCHLSACLAQITRSRLTTRT